MESTVEIKEQWTQFARYFDYVCELDLLNTYWKNVGIFLFTFFLTPFAFIWKLLYSLFCSRMSDSSLTFQIYPLFPLFSHIHQEN